MLNTAYVCSARSGSEELLNGCGDVIQDEASIRGKMCTKVLRHAAGGVVDSLPLLSKISVLDKKRVELP
jgi:hypothetical protein